MDDEGATTSAARPIASPTSGIDGSKLPCASQHPVSRLPGSESGACLVGPHSPRSLPFAPPTPRRITPLCSSASQLLWRSLTPHVRASSATAPRLPDAGQGSTHYGSPLVDRETSRFPCKEHVCMPGSPTTPGCPSACVGALGHIAFRYTDSVGTRNQFSIAAQWLACTFPCRRFADILTDACARLGADVVRYSFIVVDLHHLLLAGLPAHLCENAPGQNLLRIVFSVVAS
jgi:hypothetical protein